MSPFTEHEEAVLDAEPMCVGRATGIDGHALAAWVTPSMTWRGHPRWTPKIERNFVHWSTFWTGFRRRSFDEAKERALKVLRRLDANGERRERP